MLRAGATIIGVFFLFFATDGFPGFALHRALSHVWQIDR